jgi:integrase
MSAPRHHLGVHAFEGTVRRQRDSRAGHRSGHGCSFQSCSRKQVSDGRPTRSRRCRLLTEHKAASEHTGPDDPVFVTSSGKPRSRHNLRQDVVDAVMIHANRLVEQPGLQPLPLGITPHKLRHTYASILVAIGRIRPT